MKTGHASDGMPRFFWGFTVPVGAGLPAKQAPRWLAPAMPVFAAKAAPTGNARGDAASADAGLCRTPSCTARCRAG
ncbi:hypothetical protein FCH83_06500 [Pseudomonas putida]|nr:hypothetical protein [Pseudomonas putida]NTZ00144.1 hypothetical protein [Pseudomonas putida]NTZ22409.1 hypothetical protein [Pseudomonas putida]NTZ57544.1 hypothetical protein [Pseudomonas putida]NTZ68675.1 hypothetical protein [Pseudomonas putida]